MDPTFVSLIVFPIIYALLVKYVLKITFTWEEFFIQVAIVIFMISIVFYAGKYKDVHDYKIVTGQVTNKERIHGSHMEPYSCNCRTRTSCSGSGKNRSCSSYTECDTCWRRRYTVDWNFYTTLGKKDCSYTDSLSSSVYNVPDTTLYSGTKIGDAYHETVSYVNYIKANPKSLFYSVLPANYPIPQYPKIVGDHDINRVLFVGNVTLPQKLLNDSLTKVLMPLSYKNVILIVTTIQDKNYRFVVENNWVSGKSNDTILYVGVDENSNVTWTDANTWAKNYKNEDYVAFLRQDMNSMIGKKFSIDDLVSITQRNIGTFKVSNEHDFDYLKDAIEPSDIIVFICFLLDIVLSIGLTVLFHRNEFKYGNNNRLRLYTSNFGPR